MATYVLLALGGLAVAVAVALGIKSYRDEHAASAKPKRKRRRDAGKKRTAARKPRKRRTAGEIAHAKEVDAAQRDVRDGRFPPVVATGEGGGETD